MLFFWILSWPAAPAPMGVAAAGLERAVALGAPGDRGLVDCGALGGGRLGRGMFLCPGPWAGNEGGGRDGGAPAGY